MVVVVDHDEVAELKVASSRGGLTGNTLHGATIAEEAVGVVVDEVVAGLVEGGGGVLLGDGKTDGVGETLTKRTSGDLNAGGVVSLGVAGGDAVELLLPSQKRRAQTWRTVMETRLTLNFFKSSMETA